MHRTSIWLCALLVLAAGTADAQRGRGGMGGMGGTGGRGGGGGAMGRGGAPEAGLKFPSAKTVRKYNPATLLLDKHRKLKLTRAQETQLKDLRKQIVERNATLLARYDSLQRNFHPPSMNARQGGRGGGQGGNPDAASNPAADSTRRLAMLQMRKLRTVADSLLARRRTDVREVTGVLSDDTQRIRAADFLVEQDAKFSNKFPAAPLPRDNGGARPPRGGARPPVAATRA